MNNYISHIINKESGIEEFIITAQAYSQAHHKRQIQQWLGDKGLCPFSTPVVSYESPEVDYICLIGHAPMDFVPDLDKTAIVLDTKRYPGYIS